MDTPCAPTAHALADHRAAGVQWLRTLLFVPVVFMACTLVLHFATLPFWHEWLRPAAEYQGMQLRALGHVIWIGAGALVYGGFASGVRGRTWTHLTGLYLLVKSVDIAIGVLGGRFDPMVDLGLLAFARDAAPMLVAGIFAARSRGPSEAR